MNTAFFDRHKKTIDILFILFIAAAFLCWSFRITADLTSILAGPDEGMRYILPNFIYEHGRLPTGYETGIHGNWSYAFYPQVLGAIISAGFIKIASIFTQDLFWLVHAARLTSIIFGVIAAIFIRRSARLLFDGHKHQMLIGNMALVFFALLPQVTFLSSYVNNDIIALAGVSMIIYACLFVYKRKITTAPLVWFGMGTVCAVLGYLNSYGFVLVGALYLLIRLIQQYKKTKDGKALAIQIALAAGIPLLICLPFLIRNMLLYHGDILGMVTFRAEYTKWVEQTGIILQNPYKEGLLYLITHTLWIPDTIKSFILGYFGGWSRGVALVQYWPYYLLIVSGLIGFVARLRKVKKSHERKVLIWLIVTGITITIALNFYYTLTIDYQPQGRYIIYLAVPLILAITAGIYHFIERVVKPAYVWTVLVVLMALYTILHLSVVYQTLF